VEVFWYGFEKRAMTNKKILKRYMENLLSVMKRSSDPTDRAVHGYLKKTMAGMDAKVPAKIREMGEVPSVGWIHNVHPEAIRKLVHDANKNKRRPGWARAMVLKTISG